MAVGDHERRQASPHRKPRETRLAPLLCPSHDLRTSPEALPFKGALHLVCYFGNLGRM